MGVLAVTSKVMLKLTVALLAALICIILADVSGEQQSIETDTLSEVLSDHKLVKREADPGRREGTKRRSVEREQRERIVERQGNKPRRVENQAREEMPRSVTKRSAQRVRREKIVERQNDPRRSKNQGVMVKE